MLGVCPLMMSRFDFQQVVTSHPAPAGGATDRVLIRSPTGSERRSDCTFVTVEDVSLLLDRSGCRMVPSGSAPEGQ